MKGRTYPYLLVDFYNASHFEMINFANVKIEHCESDPVISLFGITSMQITSYMENDVTCINLTYASHIGATTINLQMNNLALQLCTQ